MFIVPTCLLYDEHGQVLAWGLEAKNAGPMPGTTRCEWYNLHALILAWSHLVVGSNYSWNLMFFDMRKEQLIPVCLDYLYVLL